MNLAKVCWVRKSTYDLARDAHSKMLEYVAVEHGKDSQQWWTEFLRYAEKEVPRVTVDKRPELKAQLLTLVTKLEGYEGKESHSVGQALVTLGGLYSDEQQHAESLACRLVGLLSFARVRP
jgi:hypothetical protein